jgi:RNA polymerase sigma-70 factor (ECF subfamily)
MDNTNSQTGATLFALLESPSDSGAWSRFVERYRPIIFRWCKSRGLQDADAEDVTQEVLGKFAKVAGRFIYDPTKAGFRAWLRTVTRHALADLAGEKARAPFSGDARAQTLLEMLQSADDLEGQLDEELQRELLQRAMSVIRQRVEPKTWRAFELLVEGRSGNDVARELDLSVAAVYMAKSRIQRMLAEEVRRGEIDA